jgi:casein kinase 1
MATTHIISTSNAMSSTPVGASAGATSGSGIQTGTSSSSNVVGVHYKVGKKVGEGSFGVIFEGACLGRRALVAPYKN